MAYMVRAEGSGFGYSTADLLRFTHAASAGVRSILSILMVVFGSRLCKNAVGPRMRRIAFSIAFFRQKLPVHLISTWTKSRRIFYTQVERQSFHTAWVNRYR
jgi:hypothetical protein